MELIDYKTLLEFLGKYEEESARVFNKLREAAWRQKQIFSIMGVIAFLKELNGMAKNT